MCRSRSPRCHFFEGASQGSVQIHRVIDHLSELGKRPKHRLLIQLSQRVAPASRNRNIGRNGKDRNRRLIRFDNTRRNISCATTGRPFANANPSRNSSIGVGHIGSVSFITGQHMGQVARSLIKSIVKRKAGITTQSKYYIYAMQFEHPYQGFSASNLVRRHVRLPHQLLLR